MRTVLRKQDRSVVDRRAQADLVRRVRNFLYDRHMPSLRQIDLCVDGDRLVLRGRVPSFYAKQLAGHCCQRVAGVVQVQNDLRVVSAR